MAFPSDILPNQFLHWNLNLKSEPVNMGFLYPPLDGAAFPPIDETLHIQVPNQIHRIPSTSSTASYTSESSTSTYPPTPTFLDQTEALQKSEDRHLASTANRSARRENRRFDPYNSGSTAHRGWYPGTGTGAGDLMSEPGDSVNMGFLNPPFDGEPEPTFPLINEAPYTHVPSQITRNPSTSSNASYTSESSFLSTSTYPPTPTFPEQAEALPKSEDKHLACTANRGARRENRRFGPYPTSRRGQNLGTGAGVLMESLPEDVQLALQVFYPGCCEVVNGKDSSTWQKHWLTKKHFSNLPECQSMQPAFICPAFISLHPKCTTAKAGRYDATNRHCKGCRGFKELFSNIKVSPLEITVGEFSAVSAYRKARDFGKTDVAPPLVDAAIAKVMKMLIDSVGGDLQCILSQPKLAPQLRNIVAILNEERSPSPSPSPSPGPSTQFQTFQYQDDDRDYTSDSGADDVFIP
ncbi:hypothetical protein BGW80DRAFT_1252319 [Lactifluus volemus]|nr:hypothetical protein BGW80DRAFT_1252319 [Lactifluus volemus]